MSVELFDHPVCSLCGLPQSYFTGFGWTCLHCYPEGGP